MADCESFSSYNDASHGIDSSLGGIMKTLVIEGGTVVTDQEQFRADLVISGDHISAITLDARGLLADERIGAEGMLIMPGGIDAHTHFREPEEFTKEGFTTGSAAASA